MILSIACTHTEAEATAPHPTPVATVRGIDVSEFQGVVDWPQVRRAGYTFAYARALDGAHADPSFATNYAGMRAAGITPGSYLELEPGEDPGTQADRFIAALRKAGVQSGDLLPAVAVEIGLRMPPDTLVAELNVAVARLTAAFGVPPVIYTDSNFWPAATGDSTAFATSPLWISDWTSHTVPSIPAANWAGKSWAIRQYSSTGAVAGITGPVDLNRSNGNLPLLPGTAK
jgi:lysozyme